jgi:hypothetical protein
MSSDTPSLLRGRKTDPVDRFVPESGNTLPPGPHDRLTRTLTTFPNRLPGLLWCGRRPGMNSDAPGRLRSRRTDPVDRFVPESGNTVPPGRHGRLFRALPSFRNRPPGLIGHRHRPGMTTSTPGRLRSRRTALPGFQNRPLGLLGPGHRLWMSSDTFYRLRDRRTAPGPGTGCEDRNTVLPGRQIGTSVPPCVRGGEMSSRFRPRRVCTILFTLPATLPGLKLCPAKDSRAVFSPHRDFHPGCLARFPLRASKTFSRACATPRMGCEQRIFALRRKIDSPLQENFRSKSVRPGGLRHFSQHTAIRGIGHGGIPTGCSGWIGQRKRRDGSRRGADRSIRLLQGKGEGFRRPSPLDRGWSFIAAQLRKGRENGLHVPVAG